MAAKELRLQWRDPRQRASVIAAAFVGVIPVVSLRSTSGLSHAVVLAAVFPAAVLSLTALNLYGFDGPKFWMHLAAGDDPAADLLGKNIEKALASWVVGLAAAVALAAVSGGWEYVVPVAALVAFAIALELGIGNVTSVVIPVPMPESNTNVWASNTTQGLQTLGPVLASMVASAVVLAPLVLLTRAWIHRPGALALLMLGEVAGGVGVWRLGLSIGVRRSRRRQPELLEALSRYG